MYDLILMMVVWAMGVLTGAGIATARASMLHAAALSRDMDEA